MSSFVSDSDHVEDIAYKFIQSICNRSSDERPCSSTSEIPQLIHQLCLSTTDVSSSTNLSTHHILELDLSNRKIRKVYGLETLIFLRRLNLSFNHIDRIEGLDSLQRLLWLSLYHNEISQAEGLSNCIALQTLSLGKNRLVSIQDNVIPYIENLRHLKDLNLKGNPCMVDNQDGILESANGSSTYQKTIQSFLPSIVYFNDVKISKASINDHHYIFMPHNETYFNILNALNECDTTCKLQFHLNQIYHMNSKSSARDVKVLGDTKIDSVRQTIETMWNKYISEVFDQDLKIIQYVACYEKYLWDQEQHQLQNISDFLKKSEIDEIGIDAVMESEISFGEKLRLKWIETSEILSKIILDLNAIQNMFYENQCNVDLWNADEQQVLNTYIRGLYHDDDMRRQTLVKAAQDLSDTWYCRHRNRLIEISRMRE